MDASLRRQAVGSAGGADLGRARRSAEVSRVGLVAGLFLLAAATLALEVALTRVFALAQGYHFAFVAVGVALLGTGASGSLLAMLGSARPSRPGLPGPTWASAPLFGASAAAAYALAGGLPFDSYRLATEPGQVTLAGLTYVALALPFFWSGLAVAQALASQPARAGVLYSANLAGSALGCILALGLLPLAGAGGAVLLAAALGAAAGVGLGREPRERLVGGVAALALALPVALVPPGALEPRLSPYRGLSQALRLPGAEVVWRQWNAFSRVDLVRAESIRSAPGLSLAYPGELPRQVAVAVDGDNLQAVSLTTPGEASFLDYTPAAVAYALRREPAVLLVEGSNADLLLALRAGARSVTAVQANPLVLRAADEAYSPAGVAQSPTRDPRVDRVESAPRPYLRRTSRRFDVLQLGLAESFRPVSAGTFSLTEDYAHTLEAFGEYYRHLAPGGLLVATRWLQVPPSDDLRFLNLAVRSLERLGVERPEARLAVLRDYQTLTLLVKAGDLTPREVAEVLAFADARGYDVVYAPGAPDSAANRYHVLPRAEHRQALLKVLSADASRALEETYPYDLRPPTDDRPFFGHLFRWQQTTDVLQAMGKTWQPFGGAGYLVVAGLLALTVAAGVALIGLPLLLARPSAPTPGRRGGPSMARTLTYFAALGVGYLAVEIPSMQKLILVLDQPTYAVAVVLASLLVWSGVGSLASSRLDGRLGSRQSRLPPGRVALLALVACLAAYQLALGRAVDAILEAGLGLRLLAVFGLLAPVGFLMGVPLAAGIRAVGARRPDFVPWAWAANGFASVTCSVLAAMAALSAGFSAVLAGAALAYAVAAATWPGGTSEQDGQDQQASRPGSLPPP